MEPEITLVTPEQAPLAIFGPRAVEVVTEELERAGVQVELGAYAELDPGPPRAIVMRPSGRRLEGSRILALPRLRGRTPQGIPADPDGFVTVDPHGRVAGVDRRLGRGRRHRLPGQVRRPRRRAGRRRRRRHRRRRGRQRRAHAVPPGPARASADRPRPALPAPRRRRGRRRGRGHHARAVVAAGQDQRPLPGPVARRARRGDRSPTTCRSPAAWPCRPTCTATSSPPRRSSPGRPA